jgi:hypothetical protein
MLTCKEAAKLISEGRDHPLSLGQRLGLRLHLLMCTLCRGYQQNLEALGRIFARAGDAVLASLPLGKGENEDLVLSSTAKRRIKEKLNQPDRSD